MLVHFTKMHGLGNDFVVIDAITANVRLNTHHIKKIADRHLGIGCDQVLILEPPIRPEADFFYRIYNSNGTEAKLCGNGALCVAQFAIDRGLINKRKMIVDCLYGQLILSIQENHLINVDFGCIKPTIKKHLFNKAHLPKEIYEISLGNLYGICIVEDLKDIYTHQSGEQLSNSDVFSECANITFMKVIDKQNINTATFERGAGYTLSCGSGTCAAVIVGQYLNLLSETVKANSNLGSLTITFNNQFNNLQMLGPATSVFIGKFRL